MNNLETKADMQLWEQMHDSPEHRQHLDDLLRESWERSDSYGIDYKSIPKPLPQAELEVLKRQTKQLYIYASSIVRPLIAGNPNHELGVMLFSDNGTLLRLYGADQFRVWASDQGIKSGTRWSEEIIGTNAFSLAQKNKKWMKVVGTQNYARFLTGGAYYFAPIKLENGDFSGGLAIVVPVEYDNKYLLALAVSISRAIELQIFWFNKIGLYSNISVGSGMLCVDQSGGKNNILVFGKEIFKMLGVREEDVYYNTLEDIINPLPDNKEFWKILNHQQTVTDRAVQINVGGRQSVISMSTMPYKERKFHMDGMIVEVNSFGRINKLVSRYAGNNARYRFGDIIGQDPATVDTIKHSKIAARTDTNILLLGESGVGKEVFAQAIHNESKRSQKPFVAINCASFSKELIASELFGYESGAFTGAKKEGALGKFELAEGGTLFLDEIGDMPLDLQAMLLRVLEERSFHKVGGNKMIHVNVRIIAATNKNLMERIRQGLFREDLFYRLGIIRINILPLHHRGDDVVLLADQFISQICMRLEKPDVRLTDDALDFLRQYQWPGNIRELKNMLEGLIGTHDEIEIDGSKIRQYIEGYDHENRIVPVSVLPEEEQGYDEKKEIIQALKLFRNNKTKAAAYLGISRNTLYKRIQEFHLC